MSVILIFVGLVFVGDAFAVMISAAVEHWSKSISLLVFFILFGAVFVAAWQIAVRIAERYLVRSN